MSETGNLEIGMPGEGQSGVSEQLSEDAKQRFAAAAAAMQAIQREEKRSKKRDARVAKTILQFLNDDRYAHLFVLISRLVARDCPSIFILAVLSLINGDCATVVKEYLHETEQDTLAGPIADNAQIIEAGALDAAANQALIDWITRMQMVLNTAPQQILEKILVDERNIDGTVLQLATFVLQEFFRSPVGGNRDAPFDALRGLTISILQTVFEPFMGLVKLPKNQSKTEEEEDED